MLDKSFVLLFYLKKPKNYEKGEVPIYLRITVDGVPKELSVKRNCDPERSNSSSGRAQGIKEAVKSLKKLGFMKRMINMKENENGSI